MTAALHLMSPAEFGRREGDRWPVSYPPAEVGLWAWLSATTVKPPAPPYSYDELAEIQRVAEERHTERRRAADAVAAAAVPPVLPPIAALLSDELPLPATPTEIAHDRDGDDQ